MSLLYRPGRTSAPFAHSIAATIAFKNWLLSSVYEFANTYSRLPCQSGQLSRKVLTGAGMVYHQIGKAMITAS